MSTEKVSDVRLLIHNVTSKRKLKILINNIFGNFQIDFQTPILHTRVNWQLLRSKYKYDKMYKIELNSEHTKKNERN